MSTTHVQASPQLRAYERYRNYGLGHEQALTAVGGATMSSVSSIASPRQPEVAPPQELDLEVTRNQLNLLLLEAHKKSATATEEVAAIRELGKINGLYEKVEPDITINIQHNVHKLEVMSDAELLKLAGREETLLTNDPIDADFEEVEYGEESEE